MAEYVISATLKLKDQLTAKLNAAKSAVSALGKSAVSNTKAATSNIGAATSNIKSATSQLQSATASLGNLKLNLSTGDLARVERLKSTLQNAGNVAAKPINLRANDSVTGKLQKIKSELQNLVNKPWTINIRENAKNLIGNAKGKISEGLSNGAMAAGATYMGLGAVGGLTVGIADAFKSQMSLEKELSAVKAINSGSFENKDDLNAAMAQITQAVEYAGATTKFTATEAAEGVRYMAMAGWDADRQVAGLMPILNLAAAGDTNLGTASDIVTDSMTGFGLKAGEYVKNSQGKLVESTQMYADLMGALVTHANTNIEMLGETLKYVSPNVGALYKNGTAEDRLLGAQDTMFITGLMANSGIKSSQAGTAARAILTRLAAQNRNAYFGEEILGVNLANENGEARRLKDIFGDFREKFRNGLSADELINAAEMVEGTKIHADTRRKLETFLENAQKQGGKITGIEMQKMAAMIAGQEAMSGFLAAVLVDDKDWNGLSDALDAAEGSVEEMSKIRMDNLSGDLTYLSSAWDAFSRNLVKGEASTGLRNFTQSITDTLSKANELFKDGIDIGDFGEIIIDVIAKLKAKFLELDGIGSILAGGALAFGLKKILALGLSVKDTFSALTKVRSAGDVGNLIRGNQAATSLSAGTVNIRAGVVNVSGAVKGLNGSVNRGVNNFGGNVNRLTTTQIAERRAQLSATAAARAQSRSDSALAAAWARPGDAKLLAQYRQADLRAAQLSARASAESARALNLRASEERAAAYYAKRESILQASESKSLQARERIGGVAGAGALAAVFGAMDVAAARSNSTFNLNEAKKQLESEQNQLKILREQGADINQINAQMAAIRAAESNVQTVTEENAINERRAGAGAVGMVAGTAIGAAAGSFIPIIGNMIGGIIGGYLGQWAGEKIADLKTERDAATSSTNSATGETGSASIGNFRTEEDNNVSAEQVREMVRRQQAAKVAAESETALKKNAVGLNRHAQDNRESQEISALTAADRKRVRAERLDAEIASNVENERARQKQAKFAQEHFSGYNKKLDFTRHFKRRDVMGGTTLGDSNVADWADSRGAGMQTVDETAADIRKKREDFASGVSKNQAELTAIDENIRAGQERGQRYKKYFDAEQEGTDIFNYKPFEPFKIGELSKVEAQSETTTSATEQIQGENETASATEQIQSDNQNSSATEQIQGENQNSSAAAEIQSNDYTSLSKTGNTSTGLEMRGVMQTAETQSAAAETQNATAEIQNAATEIQKSAAEIQGETAKNSTNSRDEKFVAQGKNGDFTRLSETGNTKTGLESRGVMQKATSETTAAIENLREMAKSFSLEDLIFGKAAANALYEETDAQNFRDLKGYERPEIYPAAEPVKTSATSGLSEAAADTGSSINFGQPDFSNLPKINIAEEISNAFAAAKSAVATEFTDLATSFSSGFESVQSAALTFFTDLATSFSTGFEGVQSSALTFFTDLATSFSTGFEGVQSSALTFFTDLATSFSTGFEGVQSSALTFFTDLATSFSSGFESVQTSALTFFTDLATSFSSGFESIQSAASAIFESISATITSSVETAHAAISTAFSSAAAEVQGIWGAIPGFFSGVFGGLGGIAAAAGSAIAAGINSGIGMIQGAWESLSGWLSSKIASISAMAADAAASIGIGANYGGTSSWQGGFTTVNEHGGELIIPPRGNAIYPYRTTQALLGEVAHNYSGTSFFSGGWSEFEGGSELMYLPRGTKIIQHAATVSLLKKKIREKLSANSNVSQIGSSNVSQIGNSDVSKINSNSFSSSNFGSSSFGSSISGSSKSSQFDSLGNLVGVDIPIYNRITGDETIAVKRAKQVAQRRLIAHNYSGTSNFGGGWSTVNEHGGELIQLANGATIYPSATVQKILRRQIQTDRLGNIRGLKIPSYNRITGDDSLVVRRAKYQAQLKQYRQQRAAISAATTGEISRPISQTVQDSSAIQSEISRPISQTVQDSSAIQSDTATVNSNKKSRKGNSHRVNWWTVIKSVANARRRGGWLNVISNVADMFFGKKSRANQANSESAVSDSASTINQMANQINSASSAGDSASTINQMANQINSARSASNSANSINQMANQINSSSINQAANQIGGAQFVSTKPRKNWLESVINIWRQAKNNRSKGGNLLSYEKIWNPIMTLNKQPILGKNPDLPQQLPALSNLLEMGNLPEIPSLDARKLEKNSTSTQSNSTSNTNNNSSATFNFGGVNINNGADFDDFVARIWSLFGQSADNFGG